jgi:hypothetical protein
MKRNPEELHAELIRTDDGYRRLAERIEANRTDAERAAFPLGSDAFSNEVWRKVEERLAHHGRSRRATS